MKYVIVRNARVYSKRRKIILIVLIVLFIELSGYGILASLSRLLNAFKLYFFIAALAKIKFGSKNVFDDFNFFK